MNEQSTTTDIIGIIVRLLGLVMLIIGLVVAVKVILEAWSLYEKPVHIERFADAIEQGSSLDKLLNNFAQAEINTNDQQANSLKRKQQPSLRVTYFIAWIVVILLLLVIGGIAMSAIKTGGQLALYDLQVKRFARELLHQAKKEKH
jgi:uncharacterized membrane protein